MRLFRFLTHYKHSRIFYHTVLYELWLMLITAISMLDGGIRRGVAFVSLRVFRHQIAYRPTLGSSKWRRMNACKYCKYSTPVHYEFENLVHNVLFCLLPWIHLGDSATNLIFMVKWLPYWVISQVGKQPHKGRWGAIPSVLAPVLGLQSVVVWFDSISHHAVLSDLGSRRWCFGWSDWPGRVSGHLERICRDPYEYPQHNE